MMACVGCNAWHAIHSIVSETAIIPATVYIIMTPGNFVLECGSFTTTIRAAAYHPDRWCRGERMAHLHGEDDVVERNSGEKKEGTTKIRKRSFDRLCTVSTPAVKRTENKLMEKCVCVRARKTRNDWLNTGFRWWEKRGSCHGKGGREYSCWRWWFFD